MKHEKLGKQARNVRLIEAAKEEIANKAGKGVFDGNPLLATPHKLVCNSCGYTRKITYLSYLKSGRFELGKTRMVEVAYAAPTISGLSRTKERITPIIIKVKCKRCGAEMSCSPLSLEYLVFTASKERKLEQMYV